MEIRTFKDSLIDLRTILEVMEKIEISERLEIEKIEEITKKKRKKNRNNKNKFIRIERKLNFAAIKKTLGEIPNSIKE